MLLSAWDIITRSWQLYRNNIKALLPLITLSFVISLFFIPVDFVFELITKGAEDGTSITLGLSTPVLLIIGILLAVLIIAAALANWWVTLAIQKSLYEAHVGHAFPHWKLAMRDTSKYIGPALLVVILVGLIVFGGIILFIIPGIIFAVWYSMSSLAVIIDDKRGLTALQMSKSLVAGRWGRVFWRELAPSVFFGMLAFFAFFLIYAIVAIAGVAAFMGLAAGSGGESEDFVRMAIASPLLIIAPVVFTAVMGWLQSLIIPLFLSPQIILYKNLKETPVSAPAAPPAPLA